MNKAVEHFYNRVLEREKELNLLNKAKSLKMQVEFYEQWSKIHLQEISKGVKELLKMNHEDQAEKSEKPEDGSISQAWQREMEYRSYRERYEDDWLKAYVETKSPTYWPEFVETILKPSLYPTNDNLRLVQLDFERFRVFKKWLFSRDSFIEKEFYTFLREKWIHNQDRLGVESGKLDI